MALNDLTFDGKPDPSAKNYYLITVNPLDVGTEYGFRFKWVFSDSALNTKVGENWSPLFKYTTRTIAGPSAVTNLEADFKTLDKTAQDPFNTFRVRFTHDTTLKSSQYDNTNIAYYKILLEDISGGNQYKYELWRRDGEMESGVTGWIVDNANKVYELSQERHLFFFGDWITQFRVTVTPVTKDGKTGQSVTVQSGQWQTTLPAPEYSVTAGAYSYNVNITNFDPNATRIGTVWVEEIVTNDTVTPSQSDTRWALKTFIYTNPITVSTNDTNWRWVRVVFLDELSKLKEFKSPYGPAYRVKPYDPVSDSTDTTAPPNPSNVTASWVGNDITVTPTWASSDDTYRALITLTSSGNSRTIGFFKDAAIGGSFKITATDIYNLFGSYPSSFTGNLQGIDLAGNINTGTGFNVGARVNLIANITPTFTATAISNGYSISFSLPTGASYAKIFEGTTSGFTPSISNLVYSGVSPGVVTKASYTQVYIKIQYWNEFGDYSLISAALPVTPIDPLAVDNVAPPSTTWSSTGNSAGLDSTGTIGFNGFLNLQWNAVSDSSLRGYRIRFRPVTTPVSIYSYVNSPGTGTTFRLNGLTVGATYEVGIATFDEFNNTSAYTTLSPNLTVSGTPFVAQNVTVSGYFQAQATNDTGAFKFGYGVETGKRGIVFNPNNYWYIDSLQSALFKIGGPTNYVSWDGASLQVAGDLHAKTGSFSGNVQLQSANASIWNGPTNSTGNITGDGFVLNNSGLAIRKQVGSIQRNIRLDSIQGGIFADYGNIAGWIIDNNSLERLTGGLYSGIGSTGTYAFWAGSSTSGGAANAAFYVTPAGVVKANNISITGGDLSIGGSNFTVNSSGVLTATGANITGQLTVTGASTITGNLGVTSGTFYIGSSASTGNRIVANSGGIAGYISGNTTPNFELGIDGTLRSIKGFIGNWTIDSTSIYKLNPAVTAGVYLDSTDAIIYTGSKTGVGAGLSWGSTNSDIVLWAGTSYANRTNANFRVTLGGVATMQGATITGSNVNSDITNLSTSLSGVSSTATQAYNLADGKNKTYYQSFQPTGTLKDGDLWFDTANGNRLYRYNGSTWALAQDGQVTNALQKGSFSTAVLAIDNATNQVTNILSNGITISTSGFLIKKGNETVSAGPAQLVLNSSGITARNASGQNTFIITNTGDATFSGTVSGATILGGNINITGETFTPTTGDSDSGAGGSGGGSSNSFYSLYQRTPIGYSFPITCVGFNAVALISTATAGVVSSWYPYYDGASDLGVKYSPTYATPAYRWRNLRLTGDAYFGGDGSSNAVDPLTDGTTARTKIYSTGQIYANTLGTATGTTLVQSSGGYIRVSSSSRRYKENIIEIDKSGYLNLISELTPVTFNYKQEFAPEEQHIIVSGLIAEDVDEIQELRTIVNYNSNGEPESISYDRLSALLVLAIKEIKDKLNSIEQRLDVLEG